MLRSIPFLYSLLSTQIRTRITSDRGATAVEYGLMVALIAVVIIAAVTFLGETLSTTFHEVGNSIDEAGS